MAAFLNEKRSRNVHISHHIVRFIFTTLLIIGFIFSRGLIEYVKIADSLYDLFMNCKPIWFE